MKMWSDLLSRARAKLERSAVAATDHCRLAFDTRARSVQSLAPPSKSLRFEGIGFSRCGNLIAVATADTDAVVLFRRGANGRFESTPYWSIAGAQCGLKYPHDVCFSSSTSDDLLAVAQRGGAIAIYRQDQATGHYGPAPAFELRGPQTRLSFSDGVAFVPPDDALLAACDLKLGSISFYRRISSDPIRFELEPAFELKHASLCEPDGLAFSACGTWLALANHGNHSVSIFSRTLAGGEVRYGPEPCAVISDPELRHPHSLAFTPGSNYLVVTNAGANYISVYAREADDAVGWSASCVLKKAVGPERTFRKINARNKMEGGPKGVAIHGGQLAICSPQHGVKIYSFSERPAQS